MNNSRNNLNSNSLSIDEEKWLSANQILTRLGFPPPIYPHRNPIGFLSGINFFAMPYEIDIGLSMKGILQLARQTEKNSFKTWEYSSLAFDLYKEFFEKFPRVFKVIAEGVSDSSQKTG